MIKGYDGWDEIMAEEIGAQEVARTRARAHHIKVEDLKHGDHFICVREDLGFVIFGEVIEHFDEYPEEAEKIAEFRARGYVFGRCYSELCPQGELGDTHLTTISVKVSRAVFERAKANGWRHLVPCN